MNSKKLSIIVVAILILLLGAWFGGSWYASRAAEERLQQFVNEKGIASQVSWDKVSATPLKRVTISGLRVADEVFVDEVIIKEFDNSENQLRFDIQAAGIKDARGYAPDWLLFGWDAKSGMPNTAPADLSVKTDLNYSRSNGAINVDFSAKEFLQGNAALKISNTYPLKLLLQEFESKGVNDRSFNPFALLRSIEDIRFNQLDIDAKDLGMVKRLVKLQQRYNGVPVPSNGDEKALAKAYSHKLDKDLGECTEYPLFQNSQKACAKIIEILKGDKSSIKARIKSTRSIGLASFFMEGFDPDSSNPVRIEID